VARILLDQVQPGMVLEQPVTNANGRMLIPVGCELNEKHIKAMKMWGIPDVSVKGADEVKNDGTGGIDPQKIEAAKTALVDTFHHTNQDLPAMQEIYKLAVIQYARSH
jgi:hypothetical protein